MRAQVEVAQIRSEVEKRIQEKEEEFDSTRRNHQRALESMQASLEAESKGKTELLRVKKKLEADINELEIALDHANKANADAQKNLRRYNEQIREIQLQVQTAELFSSSYDWCLAIYIHIYCKPNSAYFSSFDRIYCSL